MDLNIPNHVAIILDGNRRWAKENNMSNFEGHKKGAENIRKMATYILDKGVKYLSVFAFSTENFKRSSEEVKYLMNLFLNEFTKEYKKLHKENIKIIFSGRKEGLMKEIVDAIIKVEDLTKDNTGGILNICLNYGGRAEIVDTTKKIMEDYKNGILKLEDVTEDLFSNYLYQCLPPIDLLIRTSGEQRVSNFMLWQLAYAEFYFPQVGWPGFDEKEFDEALRVFNGRTRKFGGDK